MKWLHIAALASVTATSAYLIWLSSWLVHTLAARDWCSIAVGADKATAGLPGGVDALTACVGLLTLQVKALALDSHIAIGTLALCLAVLVVVVIANARIEGKASISGVDLKIGGKNDAAAGAQLATDAAKKAGQEVTEELKS